MSSGNLRLSERVHKLAAVEAVAKFCDCEGTVSVQMLRLEDAS